ncbi:hypothetical protein P691DRAFT_811939 [Macrolepiota fuliginosa MF-IS2]|uniref:Uncharacterized protein n=1 Tax=Macrolepiota fuliginosa MF-IS2 TaxID=1400762 RepID=A0A9P5XGG0_9AGAR|nr:hypothetical protein P691DRAFT_811939 [Macrolepiota fuliginosa MF-IS2]
MSPKSDSTWDLDQRPLANATGHFVFLSVASFLQHWPNTLYRNGHNIVPGTIPRGTLLYHGALMNKFPSHHDWVATDPEHANLFCFGNEERGCWQLTLMAKRELKVLYFDGNSAAKMKDGVMDSQDILIWGESRPDYVFDEPRRITKLCEWGKGRGVDGFVSEIMLCDLSEGTHVVSFLNLHTKEPLILAQPPTVAPGTPYSHHSAPTDLSPGPPQEDPLPPLPQPQLGVILLNHHKEFRVLESGSWHNHYPGDSRIQLDLTRLISFYDTDLFPSLVSGRVGKPRRKHRLEEIAKDDVRRMYKRLDEGLDPGERENGGSGVDWKAIVKVVTNRYGQRLELLQYVLKGNLEGGLGEGQNYTAIVLDAHDYVSAMLTPYAIHTAVPRHPQDKTNLSWASPVFKECSTAHTASIETVFHSQLTLSERLILDSIQDTTKEICRVLVRIWAEGMVLKSHKLISPGDNPINLPEIVRRWKERILGLMEWLAWDTWTTCRPICRFEEMCYLPTWPFFFQDSQGPPDLDDLPKPYCIRRLPPYTRPITG